MGYVLPIKSIQSEQYANRMNLEPYNFAKIDRVEAIKLKSDFLESFEEFLQNQEQQRKNKKDEDQLKAVPSPRLLRGYIQPNPANLSPAISQIVGKGLNINVYA